MRLQPKSKGREVNVLLKNEVSLWQARIGSLKQTVKPSIKS